MTDVQIVGPYSDEQWLEDSVNKAILGIMDDKLEIQYRVVFDGESILYSAMIIQRGVMK